MTRAAGQHVLPRIRTEAGRRRLCYATIPDYDGLPINVNARMSEMCQLLSAAYEPTVFYSFVTCDNENTCLYGFPMNKESESENGSYTGFIFVLFSKFLSLIFWKPLFDLFDIYGLRKQLSNTKSNIAHTFAELFSRLGCMLYHVVCTSNPCSNELCSRFTYLIPMASPQ